jgi:outer membrane protein
MAMSAQQPPAVMSVTIAQVVEDALRNYPSIRVTQEQMNAAAADIRLAQTAYWPQVEGLAQVNRASGNTFYGLLLPNAVIPGVDGIRGNSASSVWDSGVGMLVTWQPYDFGLRHSNVMAAKAAREYAQATVNLTRFDVSVAAADAFLTVVAAQQTARAAKAAVDSWETLLQSIHALVSARLRPGADESRIQSELAIARTQLFQARQAIEVAHSTVSQFTGIPTAQIEVQPGKLLEQLPPETVITTLNAGMNPLAIQQNAQINQAESQLKALQVTYRPQFFLQAVGAARGTGLDIANGTRLGGWNGLAPSTQNYGIGLTVTFPFMNLPAIRAQEAAQSATIRADQAQYQVIARNLQAQWDAARATLSSTRAVAGNTPIEVSSAQTAVNQASAQYKAGLVPIDNLAQAQRLLVQADIDDAIARLNVWRAVLQVQTVQGDIQPFISEVGQ